jgi:hypothetical protein
VVVRAWHFSCQHATQTNILITYFNLLHPEEQMSNLGVDPDAGLGEFVDLTIDSLDVRLEALNFISNITTSISPPARLLQALFVLK